MKVKNITLVFTMVLGALFSNAQNVPFAGAPVNGVAQAVPGIINAAFYDDGGKDVAYWDSYDDNAFCSWTPCFRSNEFVDAAPNQTFGYSVGFIAPGEWMKYTINVATAGDYVITTTYNQSPDLDSARTMYFYIDDVVVDTIVMLYESPASWDVAYEKASHYISLTAETHVFKVLIGNRGDFNLAQYNFSSATGIQSHATLSNTKVYPSPVHDILNIENSDLLETVQVQVYSLTGQVILTKQIKNNNGAIQMNTSALSEGLYVVKVTSNKGSYTQKFTKVN